MRTTVEPDLETRARDLNAEIAVLEGELADLEQAERDLVERHKAAGTLTEPDAVAEIHAATEAADERRKELARLREERERLRGELRGLATGRGRGRGGDGRPLALSFARDELDRLREHALRRTSYSVPAGATGHAVTVPAFPESYVRGVVEYGREQVRIADLLPQRIADAGIINYLEETVAATAADAVAPGETKPESAPTFTKRAFQPQTIAHRCKVKNQDLADLADALNVIGSSLLRGLIQAENAQLLSGDGTGANLLGFLDGSSSVPTVHRATGESRLDLILRGMMRVRTHGFADVDTLVLHPTDFLAARTEKADDAGTYLAGSALDPAAQNIWGVRTVLTTDIPVGTGLVGNFAEGAAVYVREAPRIDVGTSDDDFDRNLTTLRCEERIWLAILRPLYFAAIAF